MKQIEVLKESLSAIKNSDVNLLILKGEAGFGKTYSTLKYCKENGIDYKSISNYSTPLAFYKLLYENKDKEVLIFDDMSSIADTKIKDMFKAICWANFGEARKVSYYSTTPLLEDNNLPESFDFNPRVVLIFNKQPNEFEAIINRGIDINFFFTFKQKLEFFEEVKEEAKLSQDVLDYVIKNCSKFTQNLSIRTLVTLSELHTKKYDWELIAGEILRVDEVEKDLSTLSAEDWAKKMGKTERTYYRKKKKQKKKQ